MSNLIVLSRCVNAVSGGNAIFAQFRVDTISPGSAGELVPPVPDLDHVCWKQPDVVALEFRLTLHKPDIKVDNELLRHGMVTDVISHVGEWLWIQRLCVQRQTRVIAQAL